MFRCLPLQIYLCDSYRYRYYVRSFGKIKLLHTSKLEITSVNIDEVNCAASPACLNSKIAVCVPLFQVSRLNSKLQT